MKATQKREVTIHLELTEAEAVWLKAYMQNGFMEPEPDDVAEMRRNFFEALNSVTSF